MRAGEVEYSVLDERMRHLVIGQRRHREARQFSSLWAEGPVYFPVGDYLLWSDIPNNRVMQWAEGMGVRCLSSFAYNSNGSTRDSRGRRITCEHLTRSVVRFEADGRRTVLASAYEGRRLNSPNDLVVASDGAVWFTDPSYGILSDYEGERADPEQDGCFVYRVDPDDRGHRLQDPYHADAQRADLFAGWRRSTSPTVRARTMTVGTTMCWRSASMPTGGWAIHACSRRSSMAFRTDCAWTSAAMSG